MLYFYTSLRSITASGGKAAASPAAHSWDQGLEKSFVIHSSAPGWGVRKFKGEKK